MADYIESFIKEVQSSLKHSTPKLEDETITFGGTKNLQFRFFVDDPSQYEAFDLDKQNIVEVAEKYFGDNYDVEAGSITVSSPVAVEMPDGGVQQHPDVSDEFYNSWRSREYRLNAELDMVGSKTDKKTFMGVAREVLHDSTDRNIILVASFAAALITLGGMVANEYKQNRQKYEEAECSRLSQIWKATKSVSQKPKTWLMVTGATLVAATCAHAVRMSKRV